MLLFLVNKILNGFLKAETDRELTVWLLMGFSVAFVVFVIISRYLTRHYDHDDDDIDIDEFL
ncbi:MAG: hypothetical protein ED556_08075 [Winogradskyella sp.]|uniref:hypothetical protein n=1 Tax=Winogradskyella sp. TaxID=1883156 RepID=UPI000F3AFED1|nr:hypothetical protein [Winogradskyella sp.]RNC86246.1 MAG: hypothetical protein ED556_08075 [Winogradskyella sp.]